MSVRIYPVTRTCLECDDYTVKINGEKLDLDTARVSAYPFNRRWPGHQRQIEQTELVNFLSLAVDGQIEVEIIPKHEFEGVKIRPETLDLKAEITQSSIKFVLDKPAYFTVEPYGRHNALHILADPMPEYNLTDGNEVIYFGKGEHEVGILELKSNQTVFIDEGAIVYASIYAYEAQNIKILGRGILDNSHNKEKILFEVNAENNPFDAGNSERLPTVWFQYCTDIEIDGITIRDSLVYNISPVACKRISIKNIKIIGCWRYNSDGIDMLNCEDVEISDCFVRTYDDAICVKGFDSYREEDGMYHNGQSYDLSKNITVSNCTIWNDWGKCLEIGAETRAREMSDIVFKNCNIIHVTGPAMDCLSVDYADIHNVLYENIHIEYDDVIPCPLIQNTDEEVYAEGEQEYAPPLICMDIMFHPEYSADKIRRGISRDFTFRDIYLSGRHTPKIHIAGYDDKHKCSNILISDLYWNGKKLSDLPKDSIDCNEFCENIYFNKKEI